MVRLAALMLVGLLGLPLQACARSNRTKYPVSVRLSSTDQNDLLSGSPIRIELRARTAGSVRVAVSAVPANGSGQPVGLARLSAPVPRHAPRVLVVHPDAAAQRTISSCHRQRIEVNVSPAGRSKLKPGKASNPLTVGPPRCGQFFSPTGIWNSPLPPDAPLDPDSAAITAELVRQVEHGFSSGTPPWINTTRYSTPIYTVRRDQRNVRVTLDYPYSPELQRAWEMVPLPPGARPAAGTDQHLVVWRPSTDTMWEFWQLSLKRDGWHAKWGGRMGGVSHNAGFFSAPFANWGATATSLPLIGGLMTIAELQRGPIDHAIALAIPDARAKQYAWPAQRSDGQATAQHSVPEGARFRLDPTLDLDALGLPPLVRNIAQAAQRYGVIVRDRGGSVAFFGEDPAPMGSDPYASLFGNVSPDALLRRFPWERLQLVRMQLSSDGSGTNPSCLAVGLLCG
jgi:hypothetical protein